MVDILLIEDDVQIAAHLKHGLTKEDFRVHHFSDGQSALNFLETENINLIILDLMLPDVDGLSLLSRLKKIKTPPVLILSAKSSVEDRVTGLKTGADDYLVKPFSFAELIARIEVLLRRQEQVRATVLRIDDVVVDLINKTVVRGGIKVPLHPKEFLLLELLVKNVNKPVSKKMILSEVYETSLKAQSNLVDVLVFRLRAKFDKPFTKHYIQTNHGLGFSFETN